MSEFPRKSKVWIAATVEHDGGSLILVEIPPSDEQQGRKFWISPERCAPRHERVYAGEVGPARTK